MSVFFSIIIPTYNRAHLIGNTINSVLKQEYKNFELIVVDDGSADNSEIVVKELIEKNRSSNIKYFYKANGERAAARNFGLHKAGGDYVLFLDSDDELYSNHLTVANGFIVSQTSPEVFHLRYDIKNSRHEKISEGPLCTEPPNRDLIKGNFLSCNGVFIRKDIALRNLFNEDRKLSAAEDWELWLRLAVQFPIHYVNTITSSIFNHSDRSVLEVNKERLIGRMELMISYVFANKSITDYYQNDMYKLKASCYSYVSLHLALNKIYKKEAITYLVKSLRTQPTFVFQKRFYAILKHLL